MKKLVSLVLTVAMVISATAMILAAGDGPTTSTVVPSFPLIPPPPSARGPLVPVDVVAKGRQAVTDYLLRQVSSVEIRLSGRSLVPGTGKTDRFLSGLELSNMGYVHPGSFAELQDALSIVPFTVGVFALPGGSYDVKAQFTAFNTSGETILQGRGSLLITETPEGDLQLGAPLTLWVGIPDTLEAQVPGTITAAKWVGNWDESTADVAATPDPLTPGVTDIAVSAQFLGHGVLAFADSQGNVAGWNFKTGLTIAGHEIAFFLGKAESGDVRVLENIESPDMIGGLMFYQAAGQVYGRYPLIEFTAKNAVNESVGFGIPVWGTDYAVRPSAAFLVPVNVNVKGGGNLNVGQEYPTQVFPDGSVLIKVPPGTYHLRVVFSEVLDWTADSNPKP